MTALETLQKYGLKTDVKSIRERTGKSYSDLLVKFIIEQKEPQSVLGINYDSAFRKRWEEIKSADLSLLCSLAEKGEQIKCLLESEWQNEIAEWQLVKKIKYIMKAEGETK